VNGRFGISNLKFQISNLYSSLIPHLSSLRNGARDFLFRYIEWLAAWILARKMFRLVSHHMNRSEMLNRARERKKTWDMIIVGGGAVGVGCAVDAASRGYEVLLVEQNDFGKATSSRSTKLVHGGVRYLEQGNISLVMGALRERGILRQNAPHVVHNLAFVIPAYRRWERAFYGIGLKIYDLLSGKRSFGRSRLLSPRETLRHLPTVKTGGLRGGVIYYDGQFDDARLLINLIATAAEQGATLLNYAQVTRFSRDGGGRVNGVAVTDIESGEEFYAEARVVINATGVFCDQVRRLADPASAALIAHSRGIHLVFDRSFLPGASALMVPHTSDKRVMFAIPWHNHTLVGTTETPVREPSIEPGPVAEEIEFVLSTAANYLDRAPAPGDVLSVFAGLRPLVKTGKGKNTSALPRDHTIHIDPSGLLTITGGKWTTYRRMAEDSINRAITLAGLPRKPPATERLRIHGYHDGAEKFGELAVYGSDASKIRELIDESGAEKLHPALPYREGEVIWAARSEMARTVEDVLARRTRALMLNARAAISMAPRVAELMAGELGRDERWEAEQIKSFIDLAKGYLIR
jgi:glycerol-3-phosphate dehydrogenase